MKYCKVCDTEKSESEFYKDKRQIDGLTRDCKECRKFREKQYYYKHHDKRLIQFKNKRLRKSNGEEITLNRYNSMLLEQEHKCGICNSTMDNPCVDHDHVTGKIRMLLCNSCNVLLGHAKDSTTILKSAIEYLKKFDQ